MAKEVVQDIGVVACLITPNGELVLQPLNGEDSGKEESLNGERFISLESGMLATAGGKKEKDEKLETAIVREIKEEFELEILTTQIVFHFLNTYEVWQKRNGQIVRFVVFICVVLLTQEQIKSLNNKSQLFKSGDLAAPINLRPRELEVVEAAQYYLTQNAN